MYNPCQPAEQLPAWVWLQDILIVGMVLGNLAQWTNGDGQMSLRQESRHPVDAAGDPSSRTWNQGQWNIVETWCQWTMDHGQWSLRII